MKRDYSHDRSVAAEHRRRQVDNDIITLIEDYDITARCDICNGKLLFDPDDFTKAACPSCGVSVDLKQSLLDAKEELEAEGVGKPMLETLDEERPVSLEEKEKQELERKGYRNIRVREFKP